MSIEWDEVTEDFQPPVADNDVVEAELIPFDDNVSTTIDMSQPLTEQEARELTDHIRSVADTLYVLIARAHAGKAWEPLGYTSFAEYVRAEFDISKSRAYQLLDQAKVVAEITAAAPDGTAITITEAVARDLKHVIGELAPEIAEATAGVDAEEATAIIDELIDEYRKRPDDDDDTEDEGFDGEYTGNGSGSYTPDEGEEDYSEIDDILDSDSDELRRRIEFSYALFSSLSALGNMPDAPHIIEWIQEGRRPQIATFLPKALAWLQSFSDEWNKQEWAAELTASTEEEVHEDRDAFSTETGEDDIFGEFQ